MSNIYHLEPPTKGKVVLHTNYGDVDIELWARETPMTCRNFVQLALEGYYDGTLFHRIVKDFMIQGGDPTSTGEGGESVYGGPFKDEIHTRLKFTHRGIVAMANENKPNTNTSQFFITLDVCDHLKGKHTIFGKVTGDTIYNVLRMGEAATDLNDRPQEPIKIESVEVLWNPFDDIIPRDISDDLRRRKEKGGTEAEKEAQRKEAKRNERLARAAKKDLKLLSFGDDDEEGNGEEGVVKRQGGLKSSHDVITDDPRLRAEVDEELLKAAARNEEEEPKSAAKKLKEQMAGLQKGGEKGVPSKRRKEPEDEEEDDDYMKERRGGSASAADAAAGGISFEGADDEAAAFANKMRQQMLARKRKLGGAGGGQAGGEVDSGGVKIQEYESLMEGEKKAEQARLVKEKAEEYQKLKAEMVKTSRAVIVETGDAAKKKREEKSFHEMMTPLEMRRQKYLDKKRMGNSREDDTLSKLSKFSCGLFSSRKFSGSSSSSSNDGGGGGKGDDGGKEEKPNKTESYHGQVTQKKDILDGGDDDEDDADWFKGGLKFKKHVDDAYRGGDGRSADDYVVIHSKSSRLPKQR